MVVDGKHLWQEPCDCAKSLCRERQRDENKFAGTALIEKILDHTQKNTRGVTVATTAGEQW